MSLPRELKIIDLIFLLMYNRYIAVCYISSDEVRSVELILLQPLVLTIFCKKLYISIKNRVQKSYVGGKWSWDIAY